MTTLRRGLLRFWLLASLLWLLMAGLSYYFGYQEELHIRPSTAGSTIACLDDEACSRALAGEYLAKAAAAALVVPFGLLALGGLGLWALDGFPLPARRR
jgi:hypothetical protein